VTPREAALKLVEEEGLAEEEDPLADFIFENIPTLMPGLDYQNGVVYMTFPLKKHIMRTVGRGKSAIQIPDFDMATLCVTSNREAFEFEQQTLYKRGFAFPRTFFQNPGDTSWDAHDLRRFIKEPTEAPDPFELWQRVRAVYHDYIEFADSIHYDVMSLFLMLTYVFRVFSAIGYIHLTGTRNTGKSQNMALLNALAFNPIWQSSMSPAALFRTIGGSVGTVMIDEAESWESEANQELLRILKAGYYKGAGVLRAEKDKNDRFVPINFPAYSPKVIASINPQDPVLQSRCIIVTMKPAIRQLPDFSRVDPAHWRPLRNDLYLWAMHHTNLIAELHNEWDSDEVSEKRAKFAPDLRNREWQVAKPLLVLADYIGGDVLVAPIAEYLTSYWAAQVRNQNVVDRQALLLRSLPAVLREKPYEGDHFYLVKDIHKVVIEYLDEDAREQYKTRSVLRHLAPLGFSEKRNSRNGVQVQLHEEAVRKAFIQRRIEPFEDDAQWLEGNTDYQRPHVAALPNIWQLGEQTDGEYSPTS
jgi:hypothetical protein